MNREVFLSLLALDSYNRGYGQNVGLVDGDGSSGINELGRRIGNAQIVAQSDVDPDTSGVAAGFYGIAYNWEGQTVISYRGTNFEINWSISDFLNSPAVQDAWNGWSVGANDNRLVWTGIAA